MVESCLDGFQAGVGCDLGVDVPTGSQMCPGLFGVDSFELERFGQFPLLGDLADEMPSGACIHVCVRWVFYCCGWCESWPERRLL